MTSTPGVVDDARHLARRLCQAVLIAPARAGGSGALAIMRTLAVHESTRAGGGAREWARRGAADLARPDPLAVARPGRPRAVASTRAKGGVRGVHDIASTPTRRQPTRAARGAAEPRQRVASAAVSGGRGDDPRRRARDPPAERRGGLRAGGAVAPDSGAVAILGRLDADGGSRPSRTTASPTCRRATRSVCCSSAAAPRRRAIRSVRKVLVRNVRLAMTAKRELADSFPGAELI
jgi:hypothetical protein